MEETTSKSKTNTKRLAIIGSIAVVIAALVLYFWISSIGHSTTDNAQVDAMITPVRSVVSGYITAVRFNDNQTVKKGDTLIVIDPSDYQARVAQAEAALESAQAQLALAHSGAATAQSNANASSLSSLAAKANIDATQARVTKNEKEYNRVNSMFKDGAATLQQLEAVKAEYDATKAQLEMLKKQSDAANSQANGAQTQAQGQQSQIGLAAALVKQREAELQLANTQLTNTIIKAPFDGIISKKTVEVGQYMSIGSPICSAVDYTNLWVAANFKETQISAMRPNQEVEISVDAFPKAKIKGRVQSFGGATGAKFSLLPPDNATGNFVKITQRVPVRIQIISYPDELKGLLLPGLSAAVDVHTK